MCHSHYEVLGGDAVERDLQESKRCTWGGPLKGGINVSRPSRRDKET